MNLDIIIRYLDGLSTAEESVKVEEWLQANSRNKSYFKKVKTALLSIDDYQSLAKLDVNKDWEIIEKRILQLKNSESTRHNVFSSLIFRIAASVTIILALGATFYLINTNQNTKLTDQYYEFVVPAGQKSEVNLIDGTKVWINAGSTLRLPNTFASNNRDVWLEGEAFFDVTKNTHKPFIVHTSDINIKVLGTTFNVRAYHDEDLIETTLIEGKVLLQKISETGRKLGDEMSLEPDHKAVYFKTKDAYVTEALKKDIPEPLKVRKILISKPVDTEIATSWKEGKLMFENEKLEDIAKRLERYYGVKIRIDNEELKQFRYTGTIKKISIEQTIKALQIATSFDFAINDNEILISKRLQN